MLGKTASASQFDASKLTKEDVIIALVGLSGSGRSTFIDNISPPESRAGHGLDPKTKDVKPHGIHYNGDRVVLVDTPGLDSATIEDREVFQKIRDWLGKSKTRTKFAGVFYFQRISDNRNTEPADNRVKVFKEVCGDTTLTLSVVLVTTKWDVTDRNKAESRESELKSKDWKDLLVQGAEVCRFDKKRETAFQILDKFLALRKPQQDVLPLQDELVDLRKQLLAVHASPELVDTLQRLVQRQMKTVRELSEQAAKQDGSGRMDELKAEYERNLEEFQDKMKGVKVKIPLGKKISAAFQPLFARLVKSSSPGYISTSSFSSRTSTSDGPASSTPVCFSILELPQALTRSNSGVYVIALSI
ncbi:hypothetical protein JAAARDRAFT_197790 [Jaapia argillacea MUCL 33604]|uniref:G domain-containing protein n=1 Tax=Jaapia argillacea MUCL 33604 TaxID=933084 RepID=A0A067PDN3_9AGAM|nr:hypothetical protein JAAARDRAFT_197790 [Jaapia argillacea MUCL 33604]